MTDPLTTLQKIIGAPLKTKGQEGYSDATGNLKRVEIAESIDFGNLSLQEFVRENDEEPARSTVHAYSAHSVEECMCAILAVLLDTVDVAHCWSILDNKEKDKFEDLHRSILVCHILRETPETAQLLLILLCPGVRRSSEIG